MQSLAGQVDLSQMTKMMSVPKHSQMRWKSALELSKRGGAKSFFSNSQFADMMIF